MKRYHVMIEGRVQGVGFRSFCMLQAQQRGLTGSVKNLTNGMVEVFVQGEQEQIDDFLKRIQEGTQFAIVDDISLKECPIQTNEKRFSYAY